MVILHSAIDDSKTFKAAGKSNGTELIHKEGKGVQGGRTSRCSMTMQPVVLVLCKCRSPASPTRQIYFQRTSYMTDMHNWDS